MVLFLLKVTTKTCPKCQLNLTHTAFPNSNTSADGLGYMCRKCAVLATQARQKTMPGLVKKIYQNQLMTTKKMGRALPAYSEQELFAWMLTQGYEVLWATWTASQHDRWLSPSIDRKDNAKSYSLDNIQLITWRENLDNCIRDNRQGTMPRIDTKPVDQLSKDGVFLQAFKSAAMAARAMVGHNRNVGNITAVCHGKWPTAYGYKWRFAE